MKTYWTTTQIAKQLGVKANAVSNWKKRHEDTFPVAVKMECQFGHNHEVFDADEVLDWYKEHRDSE